MQKRVSVVPERDAREGQEEMEPILNGHDEGDINQIHPSDDFYSSEKNGE